MNLTKTIEEEQERLNAERLREYVRENPFSKEYWNITRQIEVKRDNPELADLLYKCRGVTLPTVILDDPPKDLVAALKEFALHVKDANASIADKNDTTDGER